MITGLDRNRGIFHNRAMGSLPMGKAAARVPLLALGALLAISGPWAYAAESRRPPGQHAQTSSVERALECLGRAYEASSIRKHTQMLALANQALTILSEPDPPQVVGRDMAMLRIRMRSQAYECRGLAYHHMGSHELAIDDFTKAIELAPGNAMGYQQRAMLMMKTGDHGLAIQDYSKVIELDPGNSSSFANRAWAYGLMGNHEWGMLSSSALESPRGGGKKRSPVCRNR